LPQIGGWEVRGSSFEGAGGWKFSKVDGAALGGPASEQRLRLRKSNQIRSASGPQGSEKADGMQSEGESRREVKLRAWELVFQVGFWRRWAVISFGLARV
jgi:hypothetical protein